MALPTLKSISVDQKSRDIVYGFIKRMEKSLSLKNIPSEINDICLAFYYFPEFFDKARPDRFKISADKLTVTNFEYCNVWSHTIYMKQWIESESHEIVKWTFKISRKEHHANIYLSLVSGYSETTLMNDFSSTHKPNYSLSDVGSTLKNGKLYKTSRSLDEFRNGSIVTVTLDLQKYQLLSQVDNGRNMVAFENIEHEKDIQYIFVVQLPLEKDCVTLKDLVLCTINVFE